MNKLRRVISVLLLISMIFANNTMMSFAEEVGTTVFEEKERATTNYYYENDNNIENSSIEEEAEEETTTIDEESSEINADDSFFSEDGDIDSNETEVEESMIKKDHIEISEDIDDIQEIQNFVSDIVIDDDNEDIETNEVGIFGNNATESELVDSATTSNGRRRLDNEWRNYLGEDNFYAHGNEYNQYNKQLWEFNRIREAWEYVYAHRTNEMIDNNKVNVLVTEPGKNFGQLTSENSSLKEKDGDGNLLYYQKKLWMRKKLAEANNGHGTHVASIICSEFSDRVASKSIVSGIANGYKNDLLNVYLFNIKSDNAVSDFDGMLKYFTEEDKTPKVVNMSYNEIVSCIDDWADNLDILKKHSASLVTGASNEDYEYSYNLLGDRNIDYKNKLNKAIDRFIIVGALQTGLNTDKNYDSSANIDNNQPYADCYYYAPYTNRGDFVDLYACANNLTEIYDQLGQRFDGTSSASPVVSGIVALMYYINPNLTYRQVKNILYKTAKVIKEARTGDYIRVIDARRAVEEAHAMLRDDYMQNNATESKIIFHKKTHYIMNARGNAPKRKVKINDYKRNSIILAEPYFNDCRITNTDGYKWKIIKVGTEPYKDFNAKHPNVYSIDKNVFYIDPMNSFNNEKQTITLGYFNKSNEEMVYYQKNIDAYDHVTGNEIMNVTIDIYPNEHITKQQFRTKKYALGANALINPYKMVSHYAFNNYVTDNDTFAKTEFNYDKLIFDYIDDGVVYSSFDSEGSCKMGDFLDKKSTVLKVDENEKKVYFLPHTKTYHLPGYPERRLPGWYINTVFDKVAIKGLSNISKTDLTEEYMRANTGGFSQTTTTPHYSASFKNFKYLRYNMDGMGEATVLDGIKEETTTGGRLNDNRWLYNFNTFTIDDSNREEHIVGVNQLYSLPFKNILLTNDYYDDNDLETNYKEVIVIPDRDSDEEIKTPQDFTIVLKTSGTGDNVILTYDIRSFDILYKGIDGYNNVDFKIVKVEKGSQLKYDPNSGYTDGETEILGIRDMQLSDHNLKNHYEKMDFSEDELRDLYVSADNYDYYLYLERSSGDGKYNKTGTQLIPIKRDMENDDGGKKKKRIKIFDANILNFKDLLESKGLKDLYNSILASTEYNLSGVIPGTKERGISGCWCGHKIIAIDGITKVVDNNEGKVMSLTLAEIYNQAGVPLDTEEGILSGGVVQCEHGLIKVLGLNSYINVDNSYDIYTVRAKAPNEPSLWHPSWFDKIVMKLLQKLFNYCEGRIIINGKEYRKIDKDTYEEVADTVLEYTEGNSNDNTFGNRRRLSQADIGTDSDIEYKLALREISELEAEELRLLFEETGFDIDKMSKGEEDFSKVIDEFINEMFDDDIVSYDDFAPYIKVDLREFIPTASEIVDKNFVKYKDREGREVNKCYLSELFNGEVEIEYTEPITINWNQPMRIELKREKEGYIYKFRAPKKGVYDIVTMMNGEVDPFMEIYKVEDGEIATGSYISDNDSLYNKNALITVELGEREEIYIRCSTANGEEGTYGLEVIDNVLGKKPIIGDGYNEIKLGSGEYYLYNDISSLNKISVVDSEVNVDLNNKKIEVSNNGYIFNLTSSKLEIGNGELINKGLSRGLIYLEGLSQLEIIDGYYSGSIVEKMNQIMPIGMKPTAGNVINYDSIKIRGGLFTELPRYYELQEGYEIVETKESVGGNTYNYKLAAQLIETKVTGTAKTKYKTGERYNPSGLKLKLIYADNTTKEVAYSDSTKSKFSFNPSLNTNLTVNNKKIDVTYAGNVTSQGISVIELKSVSVNRSPNKSTYYKGGWDKFDPSGLIINLIYSDNTTKETVTYNSSTYRDFSFGSSIVTVNNNTGRVDFKYKNKSGVINVNLKEPSNWIKDIKIGNKKQTFAGYTKINVDLNKGAGGDYIYLWYNTTTNLNEAIKDIKLTFHEKGANMQNLSGYTRIDYDLNKGAGGDYIYLWYTKQGTNGIKKLSVEEFKSAAENKSGWYTAKGNRRYLYTYLPAGLVTFLASLITKYIVKETRTDYSNYADLNKGAGGRYIYLRYQY